MNHQLHAYTIDGQKVNDGIVYQKWHEAIAAWYAHDDARRAGSRPHVSHYVVREVGDPDWRKSVYGPTAFIDARMPDDFLTDREYAEVIGALQICRDHARKQGREPADIISALAKLTKRCTPSTNGIAFSMIERR